MVHETPRKLGPQEQTAEFAVKSGAMTRRAITLSTFYNLVQGVFLGPGLQKGMYKKYWVVFVHRIFEIFFPIHRE